MKLLRLSNISLPVRKVISAVYMAERAGRRFSKRNCVQYGLTRRTINKAMKEGLEKEIILASGRSYKLNLDSSYVKLTKHGKPSYFTVRNYKSNIAIVYEVLRGLIEGGKDTLTYSYLAKATGLGNKTIAKHIASLISLGNITKEPAGDRYRFSICTADKSKVKESKLTFGQAFDGTFADKLTYLCRLKWKRSPITTRLIAEHSRHLTDIQRRDIIDNAFQIHHQKGKSENPYYLVKHLFDEVNKPKPKPQKLELPPVITPVSRNRINVPVAMETEGTEIYEGYDSGFGDDSSINRNMFFNFVTT